MVRQILVVLAALSLGACVPLHGGARQPATSGCDTSLVVQRTNSARSHNGIGPLAKNGQLDQAAYSHSVKMSQVGMTHDGWYDEIKQSGYPGSTAGQNVAYGYSAPGVVDAWMNSPGHRQNILNGAFHDIGVGCVSSNGVLWWTQDFGG